MRFNWIRLIWTSLFITTFLAESILPSSVKSPFLEQTSSNVTRLGSASTPLSFDAQYLDQVWRTGDWGHGIGDTGLFVLDLDDDGKKEILYGGNDSWRIASYNPEYSTYGFKYVSSKVPSELSQITVGRPLNSLGYRVYVADYDGNLEVYDATSYQRIALLTFEGDWATQMAVADIDTDSRNELVLGTRFGGLQVLDAQTLQVKWSKAINGTWGPLYLGNVDTDDALEIVSNYRVIDGKTGVIEWDKGSGFSYPNGKPVALGDVDNDGRKEILCVEGWTPTYISAYDAETQSRKWQIPWKNNWPASIYAGDINQDGVTEVAVGDDQVYGISIYNGQNQQFLQTITGTGWEADFGSLAFDDVDGDQVVEAISGTRIGLFIGSTATNHFEWRSPELIGPFSALDAGDVDNDGKAEIATISYSSDYGTGGVVSVYDAATHILKWDKPMDTTLNTFTNSGLKLVDVNGDGKLEIVVFNFTPPYSQYSRLSAVDGITHQIIWEYVSEAFKPFDLFTFVDIDLDGQKELITSEETNDGFQTYISLSATNLSTKAKKWSIQWPAVPSISNELIACNVDSDPAPELIMARLDGMYVYDGLTHNQEWVQNEAALVSLSCGDVNQDGVLEILAGTQDGALRIYDGKNKTLLSAHQISLAQNPLYGVRLVDFNQDGRLELILSDKTMLSVVSPLTWKSLWESTELGSDYTGWYNHLVVADFDRDERQEVVIGSSDYLYMFRHNPIAPGNYTPKVLSFTPNSGTIWRRQVFSVTFNEPVLSESMAITCTPEVNGWKVYPGPAFSYFLMHDPFPSNTSFNCNMPDVQDKFGFHPDSPISWSFTTNTNLGVDLFLPSVSR